MQLSSFRRFRRYRIAILWFAIQTWPVFPDTPAELESRAKSILEKRCLVCHGTATRTAGLDLSSRASALKGGTRGPAIQPGAPGRSLLLERVSKGQMPPTGALPAGEQETLRLWVAAGAPWSGGIGIAKKRLWSLEPLSPADPPAISAAPPRWNDSPIDRWVFAKLSHAGLQPSPPADRRTLIRRVTFDLLGLPPSPQEVDAFLADSGPDAYPRLIDRLLASPHYGERWARHWLDVVRFTESEGFERDWVRENAWPYRDFVIGSFNEDKPYLLFARQQIAGDVLEPVTHESITATGFLVSGPTDEVGLTSAVPEQRAMVREDQLEEMLATVGQTFLGLTVNCARCHDHKFDPIPQKDYYRMKAAFEGVWQGDRPLLTPAEQQARNLQLETLRKSIEEVETRLAAIKAKARGPLLERLGFRAAPGLPAPVAQWTFDTGVRDEIGSLHAELPAGAELSGGRLRAAAGQKEPVALATRPLPRDLREKTLEVWVRVEQLPEKGAAFFQIANTSGFRGAALDGIRYAGGAARQWENISTARFRTADLKGPPEETRPGGVLHLAIAYATDGTISLYRNGRPYGAPYKPEIDTPVGRLQTYLHDDAVVTFTASPGLELDEARLYDTALSPAQIAASFAAGAPSTEWPGLASVLPPHDRANLQELRTQLAHLHQQLHAIPEPPKVFAANPRQPGPTYLLIRGDVTRKGEQVVPAGLSCLPGLPGDLGLDGNAPEPVRRARLAEWIANPANPLFSRVMVNRIWHYHFGAGIVPNPSDLGVNGGAPSHPELLDWLAVRFVSGGWSVKKLHREILLSQTYQQSSASRPEAAAKDADNRLLWRFSPQRLEGEAIRDAMLSAAGRLNARMTGPSFRPFTSEMKGSLSIYTPMDSEDPELNRRTVYRMNVNSGGSPLLDALDCPVPSVKTPRRATTTTPLQALSLMNSPFVVRLARSFALRISQEVGGDPAAQIDRAFRLALGRPPDAKEIGWSQALLEQQGLPALCWGLFNTDEFLYEQ